MQSESTMSVDSMFKRGSLFGLPNDEATYVLPAAYFLALFAALYIVYSVSTINNAFDLTQLILEALHGDQYTQDQGDP